MGPPIERWCQVSVEMGPPIERRCQVSNPLIKHNPQKFINFRPAEVCMYYVYTYVYTYVYLPKHSPHASHPANLAPQAKSASSMYFLESSWAWSDNWSFYNIFGFSFNFLCCHRAEEQHELNLSLQIVWSPWVWIPGTVCRVLQTFKAWRSG